MGRTSCTHAAFVRPAGIRWSRRPGSSRSPREPRVTSIAPQPRADASGDGRRGRSAVRAASVSRPSRWMGGALCIATSHLRRLHALAIDRSRCRKRSMLQWRRSTHASHARVKVASSQFTFHDGRLMRHALRSGARSIVCGDQALPAPSLLSSKTMGVRQAATSCMNLHRGPLLSSRESALRGPTELHGSLNAVPVRWSLGSRSG